MKSLTGCAVAVFASQWLVSAQLVLDFPAMAAALPLDGEVLVLAMDAVWFTVLPCVDISMCGISSLVLVSFWMNRAVGLVIALLLVFLGRHC